MPLPHYFNRTAHTELWIDEEMNRWHLRLIKLQKIRYKMKHKSTEGFEPKRPKK